MTSETFKRKPTVSKTELEAEPPIQNSGSSVLKGPGSKASLTSSNGNWWTEMWLGPDMKHELWTMLRLGAPICVIYQLNFTPGIAILSYAGHLGRKQLAATGLLLSFLFMALFSVAVGAAGAMQGQFARFWGSGDSERLRIHLQRGLVASVFLYFMICFPLFLNAELIFYFLGQQQEVSQLTAAGALVLLPGALGFFFYEVVLRFLFAQEILWPVFFTGIVLNVLAFGAVFFFLFVVPVNFIWAMIAVSIAFILLPLVLWGFMHLYESQRALQLHRWSLLAFMHLRSVFDVALPLILQIEALWFLNQACTIQAGIIGERALNAQAVLMRLNSFFYLVPTGFSAICITRIAMHLGSFDGPLSRTAFAATTLLHIVLAAIMLPLLYLFRYEIAHLATNDREIAEYVAQLIPYAIIGYAGLFIEGAASSHLRATGKLVWPAIFGIVIFYGFALPLTIVFGFYTPLGFTGIVIIQNLAQFAFAVTVYIYALCVGIDPVINELREAEAKEHQPAPIDSSKTEKEGEARPLVPQDHVAEPTARTFMRELAPIGVVTIFIVVVAVQLRLLQGPYLREKEWGVMWNRTAASE